MTRWSLRRRRPKNPKPVKGKYRIDPAPPHALPPGAYLQDASPPVAPSPDAFTPGGYRPDAYQQDPFRSDPYVQGAPGAQGAPGVPGGPRHAAPSYPTPQADRQQAAAYPSPAANATRTDLQIPRDLSAYGPGAQAAGLPGRAPGIMPGTTPDSWSDDPWDSVPQAPEVPAPQIPHAQIPHAQVPGAQANLTGVLPRAGGAWPHIMEQFGLHLLGLAEQLRMNLDELEADEDDPERLQKLYRVDHAVTRMRRASRDLRTLAGRGEEDIAGTDTSLLDVIRMALSAIERYTQVSVGRVADLAVLGHTADDLAALLAALLDNATRYSPATVSVSAHLTEDGDIVFRIEDSGIGINPDEITALNAMLAGDVPDLDERTGRHTGLPVVHRIARKYGIGVRLAARPSPNSGTIANVTIPSQLVCEIPEEDLGRPEPPPPPRTRQNSVSVLPTARRGPSDSPPVPFPARLERPGAPDSPNGGDLPGSLPRRERASLRGDRNRRPGGRGSDDDTPAATPEEQAAARRAFADDLNAFSLGGSQDSAGKGPTS
jgi:hypothetical protein